MFGCELYGSATWAFAVCVPAAKSNAAAGATVATLPAFSKKARRDSLITRLSLSMDILRSRLMFFASIVFVSMF